MGAYIHGCLFSMGTYYDFMVYKCKRMQMNPFLSCRVNGYFLKTLPLSQLVLLAAMNFAEYL